MNVEVTSVSKKEQKLSQVAAAIFVISQEDIARSGATGIPDLLRMLPGLNVAQINANTWGSPREVSIFSSPANYWCR
jgi:iron complex outermembrane recepter protein